MNKPVREGFVAETPTEPPADVRSATIEPAVLDAEAPAEPAPFVETWPVKVKLLHKPIRDNKGVELKELSFRQPTGADINRYGMPIRIDASGEPLMDERKMTLIMTALTGVMTPFLETMDPRDWASCAYRLRHFFMPDPAAW
jgi:tail assembly chaperone E/41/14-like protein